MTPTTAGPNIITFFKAASNKKAIAKEAEKMETTSKDDKENKKDELNILE